MMQETVVNGMSYLQFESWLPKQRIQHGFFTRRGGASHGAFSSLNVSFGIGDQDAAVEINRQKLAACFPTDDLLWLRQIHGSKRLALDRNSASLRLDLRQSKLEGDALITDCPGDYLLIQVADCQPVFLYAADRHVIANIHVGWRGSVQNIIGRTVAHMVAQYGCDPGVMHAAIGPSLGPCCAEFVNYRSELPQAFWAYRDRRDHFDFWAISQSQLQACGVLGEHINISQICTRCQTQDFYSYRGEGRTGRFAAFIGLRPEDRNALVLDPATDDPEAPRRRNANSS
jgi:YfiH family protein